MKPSKYLPLVIFICLIALLSYKSFITTNNHYGIPKNLSLDISKLISIISNKPIKQTDEKYILHIFSSWCPACKHNHHALLNLSKKDRIKIIGVIWQDSKENIEKMLQIGGNPYYDLSIANEDIIIDLGISGLPNTFVIGKNNQVLLRISGELKEDELRNAFHSANN